LSAPYIGDYVAVPATPVSPPKAAIMRPMAVAACDFDRLLVSRRMRWPMPIPIGHEFVAEVVEVRAEVTIVKTGDRVVASVQINCGVCAACLRGHTSSLRDAALPLVLRPRRACRQLRRGDVGFRGGAVRGRDVDASSRGLSPADAAACSCNVTDAYRCVGPQLLARPGSAVLVGQRRIWKHRVVRRGDRARDGRHAHRHDRRRPASRGAGNSPRHERRACEHVAPGTYPITVDANAGRHVRHRR
jgi:hypothetical protein